MKYFFILFFLYSSFVWSAKDCNLFFKKISEIKFFLKADSWPLMNPVSLKPYEVKDFLPEDYIKQLEEKGLTLKLKIRANLIFGTSFNIYANSKQVVHFYFWNEDKNDSSVIIEDLLMENPITQNSRDSLHTSQEAEGLPIRVAMHLKKHLYQFLAAGNYKNLAALSSQNYLVGSLYRRLLGGVQSEVAKKFSNYLVRLYKLSNENFPEPYKVKDLDQFSEKIGDASSNPWSINSVLFTNYTRTRTLGELEKLEDVFLFRDPETNNPIAIGVNGELIFLYQDKEKYHALSWRNILLDHPDWVRVDVPLDGNH